MTSPQHNGDPGLPVPSILEGINPGAVASPESVGKFTNAVTEAISAISRKPELSDEDVDLVSRAYRRGTYVLAIALDSGRLVQPEVGSPLRSKYEMSVTGFLNNSWALGEVLKTYPNETIQRAVEDPIFVPEREDVLDDNNKARGMFEKASLVGLMLRHFDNHRGAIRGPIENLGMGVMGIIQVLIEEKNGLFIDSKIDFELRAIADAYQKVASTPV